MSEAQVHIHPSAAQYHERDRTAQELARLTGEMASRAAGGPGGGGAGMGGLDAEVAVLKQRADNADQHLLRIDAKSDQIVGGLNDLRFQLVNLSHQITNENVKNSSNLSNEMLSIRGAVASKESVRNWGVVVVATIIASVLAFAAITGSMQSNTLAAFQSGLSALQTVATIQSPVGGQNAGAPPTAPQ